VEATSLVPLAPRPGDQYRLRNLRSSMRKVMTRRSKMSSAISTTDNTEEPNHRLHWLPKLDRRVTICVGREEYDHGAGSPGWALTEEPVLTKPSPFVPEDPTCPQPPTSPCPLGPCLCYSPEEHKLLVSTPHRKLVMRPAETEACFKGLLLTFVTNQTSYPSPSYLFPVFSPHP
jgi:hypothetical protein